jgi:ABC-type sulfate transport system permease subunit
MASNKGTPLLAIIPLGIALSPLVANAIYWVITGKEKTLGDFLK